LPRGYDSDPLRQRLRRRGIDLIVPFRKNNQHRRRLLLDYAQEVILKHALDMRGQ
jgi:IS5 family transposase